MLVVDMADVPAAVDPAVVDALTTLPAVVVGVLGPAASAGPTAQLLADVLVDGDPALAAVTDTVEANPIAATALALLLRGSERRSWADGLLAESATYSLLQGGPEFARWREGRPRRERPEPAGDAVRWVTNGSQMEIALARPAVHNAYNRAMRDGLVEALSVAAADPSIDTVHLRGDGSSFCSGGDLDEFGTRPDPATAHLVRLSSSAARLLREVGPRVTAHLHGACMGSGIELPAFAARVLVAPDTRIGLPEIGLGLIPGAGGTVSLPGRIGRHQTAYLALSGVTIDAATAISWGLADGMDTPALSDD